MTELKYSLKKNKLS